MVLAAGCGRAGRATGPSGFGEGEGDGTSSGDDGFEAPPSDGFGEGVGAPNLCPTSADEACATTSQQAVTAPVDIFIMLDTSASMLANGKWQAVTGALQSFFKDARAFGLGVGIQYFPLFAGPFVQCAPSVYAEPNIAVFSLPLHEQDLLLSLGARAPAGGTPMAPALRGAHDFARGWAQSNPDRKTVVLLATDGEPDPSCGGGSSEVFGVMNSITGVSAVASAALAASPSIPTFVIGVGAELTALNAIAAAGGTEQAAIVTVGGDTSAQFLAALDRIRKQALGCDYAIPPEDSAAGREIDFGKVNVRFTRFVGDVPETLGNVATAAECGTQRGWYYDTPSASSRPRAAVLCPAACADAKESNSGRIDLVLGCKTLKVEDVRIF
jgi:hypothetical protein